MASTVPVVGETFTFGCSAVSQADTNIFQAAATIAAGDFQRSINGGAFANLDNTPTVTPAAGKRIQFVISAAETTAAGAGGEIYIVGSDQVGGEWKDFALALRVFESNLDALATAAALATIDGIVDAIVVDTGTDIPASIAALNDLSAAEVNAEVVDALATDVIADSIPADGSRPTIAQALYMLVQYMNERSVSTTTVTVKKPDGASTLYTLTLDDASDPTSVTRTT